MAKRKKNDNEYFCTICDSIVSEDANKCSNCNADLAYAKSDGLQYQTSNSFNIWDVLVLVGVLIIIVSSITGTLVISELGWDQVQDASGEVGRRVNLYGMGSGIGIIFQGVVIGLFMLGFSKLGDYVHRIVIKIEEK